MQLPPIFNCHTHIFTARDVPPWIAKKFIPWPFYYLTHFPSIFWIATKVRTLPDPLRRLRFMRNRTIGLLKSNFFTQILFNVGITYLLLNALYFIMQLSGTKIPFIPPSTIDNLEKYHILQSGWQSTPKLLLIFSALLITPALRKIIWYLLKLIVKPLSLIPSEKTSDFLARYFKIVAIARYKKQATAFNKLYKMYPPNSKFVVLSMDMEFMGAGKPQNNFLDQLSSLNKLASNTSNENYSNIIPFLFVDPRRIEAQSTQNPFFKYKVKNNRIILQNCTLKKYLETDPNDPMSGHFKGIKIYPALGYYPFDEHLLPLYLYCVQNDIPVTTHCTIGTIFYRGRMKKSWFKHPVFDRTDGSSLNTPATKNIEVQRNFTHPLNYLVLLEPYFLKKHLKNCSKSIQELFGFKNLGINLEHDLSKLKLNIAHYGGIDEWDKFLDADRGEGAQQVIRRPNVGLQLMRADSDPTQSRLHKPFFLWRGTDWYSIISALMLQYENVYADISYILHSNKIQSLLKASLMNEGLSNRILFGTDFYVVRHHKSEKELFIDMLSQFSATEIDQIARTNPSRFLGIKLNNVI